MFRKKENEKALSRREIIDQWLELFPFRQMDYESGDDDRITVLVPHPENWLTRKLLPKPKHPAQKIRLDEIGSFVWRHFDGKHSINTICEKLDEKFGKRVESSRERTVIFAQQLYKNSYIKVFSKKNSDQSTAEDPAGDL
ncbi:MAG: PqqD family protein [Calditrichaeota bacterium]|nr:PqqD family protein [Calditrichota bacterium]RQV92484.1 MAG: PqqD family protein [bacterium]RQV99181.1 MAG: PqqD family protein [Calditrichota bacterium]